MEHSSSDAEDAESMFPTANDPVTTNSQFDSILNTASGPVSDLSPPASQDPPGRNGALAQDGEAMDIGNGERGRKGNLKSEFAKTAASTHEPGASWNNRKAKDEWQRAWNSLEDKTFSLSEWWPIGRARHDF